MLTILKFTLLLLCLLLLSMTMILVAPFVAIYMACSYTAIGIVSSLCRNTNQTKKE